MGWAERANINSWYNRMRQKMIKREIVPETEPKKSKFMVWIGNISKRSGVATEDIFIAAFLIGFCLLLSGIIIVVAIFR